MDKTICELFAGVGGFRLGMDRLDSGWNTVWFSQWEPGKKKQWAHDCYVKHFGDCADKNGEYHTCEDISTVDKSAIPDFNVLMGGFPCQDYSVARSLSNADGIEGKKGVLWWQIRDVVVAKKPSFCLFENVDRLLKSPAKQRGRDFGIMLATLNNLGYDVEWRVVNAAIYGGAQRRRRVFIFAYRRDTKYCKNMNAVVPKTVIDSVGFMAKAFPIKELEWQGAYVKLDSDLSEMSDNFSFKFLEAGFMRDGDVFTGKVIEDAEPSVNLGDILEPSVDEKYFLSDVAYDKYKYLKGAKRFERTAKTGYTYMYSEGPVAFPDAWDKPARTLLTGEGDISRTTHVVVDKETGRYRNLTPVETERLQGFDDDWTKETIIGEMSDNMRRFCMGNALVVPMITRMGRVLDKIVSEE